MRLRFSDTLPVEDLRRQVDDLVAELVNFGVDEMASVNIYFQPRRDGRPLVVRAADGTEVAILEVGKRRTSAYAEVGIQSPPSKRKVRK